MSKLVILIFFALSCLSNFVWAQPSEEPSQKKFKKNSYRGEVVFYKKAGRSELKLHLYKPGDWKAEDKRPAIIFFFGGGWVGGNPGQFFKIADYFSSLGYVAASVQYRTRKSHKTTPFECVADGKSAVRYFRKHAAELGVDPEVFGI